MNQAFEVLPFGRGGMEGEMERSRMPALRGGRMAKGAAKGGAKSGQGRPFGAPPAGHVPFRARYGRRRYFAPPWPYYYGPYGPGWTYGGPATVNVYGDGDAGGNGGFDGGLEAGDGGPQGEFAAGCGCNCPKCRQRATVFEVLPFG